MSSDALPEPGGVEVEPESDAAATVEELARAGVWGEGTPERVLIALDIDGTVILEDESMSPGVVDAVAHAARGDAVDRTQLGRDEADSPKA